MDIKLVDIPPVRAIAVDGTGKPGGEEFTAAVQALYSVAYALRFALKAEGIERKVGHLEGLWDRDWHWTLFIAIPDEADPVHVAAAIEKAREKAPAADRIRIDTIEEGTVVEALHVGPYATEPETVAAMEAFAGEQGLEPRGPHHEIYLSDPRRTAPDRLKTILRHPVAG